MGTAEVIVALLPLAEKIWELISKAISGEKLTAQQIKDEMYAAADAVDARLAKLPVDIAANDAAVDAQP